MTGFPAEPLGYCRIPLAEYADGVMEAIKLLAPKPLAEDHRGGDLMKVRAEMTGDGRKGDISMGGSCRLLPCRDGEIAINLARESDWELVPAWLLADVDPTWAAVVTRIAEQPKSVLLDQGRLLGLAVADAEPPLLEDSDWFQLIYHGNPAQSTIPSPRVIDLSSLWAGPLCGQILQWCGAEVLKVESTTRPDGARFGSDKFFQFLNAGKTEITLDLGTEVGVEELRRLILSSDVVIEASRPRALRQMGIMAEDLIAAKPGLTWIGISGYGRNEPEANWIAYGDDAGVAGGLSAAIYRETGQWMFCGDAIADPLTGLHAALAALASQSAGGGHLLSLSLVEIVRHCVTIAAEPSES